MLYVLQHISTDALRNPSTCADMYIVDPERFPENARDKITTILEGMNHQKYEKRVIEGKPHKWFWGNLEILDELHLTILNGQLTHVCNLLPETWVIGIMFSSTVKYIVTSPSSVPGNVVTRGELKVNISPKSKLSAQAAVFVPRKVVQGETDRERAKNALPQQIPRLESDNPISSLDKYYDRLSGQAQ